MPSTNEKIVELGAMDGDRRPSIVFRFNELQADVIPITKKRDAYHMKIVQSALLVGWANKCKAQGEVDSWRRA